MEMEVQWVDQMAVLAVLQEALAEMLMLTQKYLLLAA